MFYKPDTLKNPWIASIALYKLRKILNRGNLVLRLIDFRGVNLNGIFKDMITVHLDRYWFRICWCRKMLFFDGSKHLFFPSCSLGKLVALLNFLYIFFSWISWLVINWDFVLFSWILSPVPCLGCVECWNYQFYKIAFDVG